MSLITELQTNIKELEQRIKNIQKECNHPKSALTKKYGSNTGNYDPHVDCCWTDFHCGICDKRWTEDGSK